MLNLSSANAFHLVMSKILLFGKRLMTSSIEFRGRLTHSHTMTPFDAPGKQAF